MSKKLPSLAALLGLVAIAGYQNRDKIGEFVKGLAGTDAAGAAGGMLESAKKALGDSPAATTITGGLGELLEKFKTGGEGETAESWIGTGPNKPIEAPRMEKALGSDLISELAKQTGLSRDELLTRLTQVLPEAVDKMTPGGRLPS
jgi:uncharacterized protein YidB (DUF937 family)